MISKFWWMLRCYVHMRRLCGWANWGYIASLHETYVIENSGCEFTPEDALSEDMSYWD